MHRPTEHVTYLRPISGLSQLVMSQWEDGNLRFSWGQVLLYRQVNSHLPMALFQSGFNFEKGF